MTRKKIFIIFALLALCLTCCFALTACKKCKHANTHEQTVTQADCDSAGSVNIICDDCGATVETKTVNALGHTYGDWNVTLSPTVYADGEMQRVCGRNAKHIESKPIPKLEQGGDYTVTVTEQPDCTKKGKLTYQSSVYGTYEVDIPAELHTYDDEREGYCKVCGKYKPNEKFSGKGHVVHICKICSRLSAAEQAKATTLTRLENLTARRLNATDKKWLENRVRDRRPEVPRSSPIRGT